MDSEQTAKALLSKGRLRNRVTIIPLNKVGSAQRLPLPASHLLSQAFIKLP